MKCPKCGNLVLQGSKFCKSCGTALSEENTVNEVKESKPKTKSTGNNSFIQIVLSSLLFLLNIVLKPVKTLKSKMDFYSEPKNGFILAGVVAVASMILNVIMTLFMALVSGHFGDVIKYVDWLGITLKHLAIVAVVILAIAGVYHVISLIFKKTPNYIRLMVITAVSYVPMCLVSTVIVPILSWLLPTAYVLNAFISVMGTVYTLVIFFSLINDELNIENKDFKIYFNLICIGVIIIALYIVVTQFVTSAIGGNLGNLGLLLK